MKHLSVAVAVLGVVLSVAFFTAPEATGAFIADVLIDAFKLAVGAGLLVVLAWWAWVIIARRSLS